MSTFLIALLLFTLNVAATTKTFSQTISIEAHDASLKDCIRTIQNQTSYGILYHDRTVRNVRNINVSIKNAPIEVVLEKVLKNTGLTFEIKESVILIKEAPVKTPPLPDPGPEQAKAVFVLTGKVIDATDKQTMPMVQVGIKALNNWTVTDINGNFSLPKIPEGKHMLLIRCLGYTTLEQDIIIPTDAHTLIELVPTSLALGEVVVTAKRGTGIATSSVIERSAIEHLQPSSITEIMQLLPGQIAVNPNMSGVSQLGIREITGSSFDAAAGAIASLGTGLRIDGAPVSNHANMQILSTATSEWTPTYQSTALQGVDMRQFPVDNIESVEVVRGIPGVEEGDALSGVVRVNLIKGRTPLTTRVKIDPNIKQAYVGKGFNIPGNHGGTINMDLDMLQNQVDVRSPNMSFNRISGYVAYNNTFLKNYKPLLITFSTRYGDTRNLQRSDPDKLNYEYFTTHDKNLSLTLSGRWALNSAFLTNLNFNVSGNTQRQETDEQKLRSASQIQSMPISITGGEHEGIIVPARYISKVIIEGKPYYFNATLNGTKTFNIQNSQHTIRIGAEYNISGNKGRGSIFDLHRPPPGIENLRLRPRPFYDIPALKKLAFYLAEEMSLPIGRTRLNIHAGLRFSNIQPDGIFTSAENMATLDPRLNLHYIMIDRPDKRLSKLGIRFGYGILSLSPALLHLYPDLAYHDRSGFNYYSSSHSLSVFTTKITDTKNNNLKPTNNIKYETGVDINLAGLDIVLTGYQEKTSEGYTLKSIYEPFAINKYEQLTRGDLAPFYLSGAGVVYNCPDSGLRINVPSSSDTSFVFYSTPTNAIEITKKGFEFDINFGKINALHTTVLLSGAYMLIKTRDTQLIQRYYASLSHRLVGIYPAGAGSIAERINTNLRTVTYIRPLAMVVSLTAQIIWKESFQNIYEDKHGNPLFITMEPLDDLYSDVTLHKYSVPMELLPLSGERIPWKDEYANTMPYKNFLIRSNSPYYYYPITDKPLFQLNMRLSKELSKNTSLSFLVNNITFFQPLQKRSGRINEDIRYRNQNIYFSGELTIRI